MLLPVTPSINVQASDNGATPIYIAAQSGFSQCINLLAALGADMNKQDNKGLTPLHQAIWIDD
jgi:ankyrin repeat protein